MKNNRDIGSALKSKLEDLQNSPDDFVWEAIEEKLKKKKRRLLFWYFTSGLGLLILSLFIFNTFNSSIERDSNNLKVQEQHIDIVNQDDKASTAPNTNFENKNSSQQTNAILNSKNQLSNSSVSSIIDSIAQHKESIQNSKNSRRTSVTSEKQKLANSVINKKESDTSSPSNGLNSTDTNNSIITNKNDLKSLTKRTQTEEQRNLLKRNKEKATDSLLRIENDVFAVSEEEKTEKDLDDNKKVKDSITERETRWSINLQLIQSNHGAFNVETTDNTSINYGLLLGVRMTSNTFLRVGVRKLDLMQTVNNLPNTVSYLEIPLEVKYFFRDKKFNPYLSGGLSYFMFENTSSENAINLEYSDNVSINFGLGLEHKLFDRFYINLESNFNYQIEPITSNIDYTPYILSISTGIDYRF